MVGVFLFTIKFISYLLQSYPFHVTCSVLQLMLFLHLCYFQHGLISIIEWWIFCSLIVITCRDWFNKIVFCSECIDPSLFPFPVKVCDWLRLWLNSWSELRQVLILDYLSVIWFASVDYFSYTIIEQPTLEKDHLSSYTLHTAF